MIEEIIYIIGICMALCYIFFGIDDILWDLANLIRKVFRKPDARLPIDTLDMVPPKLLAVMIAAWHEENVLEPVVDNMVASIHYPPSMYHIFLGVYPNDKATVAAAERLSMKYDNVHVVVNIRPGPTCKADNVNSIIRAIRSFEGTRRWRFASVTVHDSEDVIHPYELKVTNYLIDLYDALQFPVFPLQVMPTWRNFLKNLTSGTYADEFAEHHYRTMGIRDNMSAVVPSAGTGFVISHHILDDYEGKDLFPEGSLTEDYKLSLTFAQKGYKVHFVLEKARRLTDDRKVKWDYIATRSIFPATFSTAVRQKTRWTYGITMQSVKFSEIFAPGKMTFAGRYTIYKDLKSKFSNLVILPGYLVLLYNILSFLVPGLPNMYPNASFSWWLTFCLMLVLLFRTAMRAVAIMNIYGFKSVFFGCLLPPVMPIRLVWGNIINLTATLRAWRQLLFGVKTGPGKKKVAWNKTDHEFLEKQILFRYYRNLGDVLLEKEYIGPDVLKNVLEISRNYKLRLTDILLSHNVISEDRLADAVAASLRVLYIRRLAPFDNGPKANRDDAMFWKNYYCPILRARDRLVYAVTVETPPAILDKIKASGCSFVFTTKQEVIFSLIRPRSDTQSDGQKHIADLLSSGAIGWEQAVLALDNLPLKADIANYLGLAPVHLAKSPERQPIRIVF